MRSCCLEAECISAHKMKPYCKIFTSVLVLWTLSEESVGAHCITSQTFSSTVPHVSAALRVHLLLLLLLMGVLIPFTPYEQMKLFCF